VIEADAISIEFVMLGPLQAMLHLTNRREAIFAQ